MRTYANVGLRALCLALALGAFGCAQAPSHEAMTARTPSAPKPLADKTLVVENVLGERPDRLGRPSLGAAEFHRALVGSLRFSGLFRNVATGGARSWTLKPVIISQETRGTYTNIEEMMIRYDILDAKSGRRLFSEAVFTSGEMGIGKIYSGNERVRVLIENTAPDNISEFIRRLRLRLSKDPTLNGQSDGQGRRRSGPTSAFGRKRTLVYRAHQSESF